MGDQAFCVREDMSSATVPGSSLGARFGLPLSFQLSVVKTHGRDVA
jgi:hypothetical protein